jgi:guanylate kinase
MKKILLTLTGISGSGKTTVLSKLEDELPYHKVITCTTRDPRPSENEVHGIDYFFLNKKDFEKQIGENGFVEHEKFDENYYGTPWSQIKSKDTLPVAILEANGAQNMKALFSKEDSGYEVIRVLLECPKEVAIERITKRDSTIPERLEKRLNSINGKESDWQDREYDLKLPFGSSIQEIHELITKKIIDVQANLRTENKSKSKIKNNA